MKNFRTICRLDIKSNNVIKGVQFEGLRIIGDPYFIATQYYDEGIDEILYLDTVASLYGRNNLLNVVERAAKNIFVPMTVGGGVRSVQDVDKLLRVGADKVAINSSAIFNPKLLNQIANEFGSQCVVHSIEAKRIATGSWEAYAFNGREKTGLRVEELAKIGEENGAGEILLTSVDRDGTLRGADMELIELLACNVKIPLIVSGGIASVEQIKQIASISGVDGIAVGTAFHKKKLFVHEIKDMIKSC